MVDTTDMTNLTSIDAAPADAFDVAFALPPHLADIPEYSSLHSEIVARMRREASGLPMITSQYMLIERICRQYIIIRSHEDLNDWRGMNQQKEANDYLLKLMHEFNTLLAQGEDKRREALLAEIEDFVIEGIELVENKENRQAVRRFLSEKFASIGL